MKRPTLEDQIRVSKMTDRECVEALLPHTPFGKVDFWLHWRFSLFWSVIHWNWFDIWEGSENADKYRSWYIKLKRHFFGGNKQRR